MEIAGQRLLATMPLHAITTTYGEAGLRQRLAAEVARLPPEDQERVDRALALASRLHAADRRQREPYVNHLLRVTIRIIAYYGVRDADVICAALLHDAVEDHADELAAGDSAGGAAAGGPAGGGRRQAALAAIAARFGPRVSELVAAVTNPRYEPGRDRNGQYREHVAASLDGCPWARVIKASDFTDNGAGLIYTTGARLDRLAAKYAPLVPVLRELIARADTPLSDEAKAHILRQLRRAAERLGQPPAP